MINPKISILLAAYKSEHILQKVFLESLWDRKSEHWKPAPASKLDWWYGPELIIYDNGGNGDLQWIYDMQNQTANFDWLTVRIIGDGTNVGLNKALNECAKVAKGDYFYLPHTDMHLLPGWDVALLNECKNLPPTSFLLCSRSIEPGHSHILSQIIKDYGNTIETFQRDKLMAEYQQYVEKKVVVNARMPFFLHRKLWERIGGVDENYFSYCTDDDLIQQCYDAGVRKFWMVGESLVYHLQGKSNAQQNVDRDSEKPYNYFIEKWKKKYPDVKHPGQYHPKLIPFETRIK